MNLKTSLIQKDDEPTQEWLQVVWGEVYIPNVPDSGGDFMDAATIREMAYDFMRTRRNNMIDVMHNNRVVPNCCVVESFIAREDDTTFIPLSWVVGVYIGDDDLWSDIVNGTYNGFSLEALAKSEKKEVTLSFYKTVTGVTTEDNGHYHTFTVQFDDNGDFLGGETSDTLGHKHKITRGTITDDSDGHHHKFHYVDNFGEITE